jgi:hypothetical protein
MCPIFLTLEILKSGGANDFGGANRCAILD